MRKIIFILLLLCHISLHATDKKAFEWIYNDDKSCSVYLEKTNTKDRKIFWSGKCPNKKINGYGIFLLTGIKDGKHEKLLQMKGLAHNGIIDGKVFLQWFDKYGTRGSYIIEDEDIKVNTTAYYIYPDYNHIVKETFKENSKNKKKAIKKSDNPAEYKKAEKLVYKYETIFKNSLTECESEIFDFKLSLYEHDFDNSSSYTYVLMQLDDLLKCQLKDKQYKSLVNVTDDFLQKVSKKEKEEFEGKIAEAIGISYYYLKDFKKSLNYFSKAKIFSNFKETKAILNNKSMQVVGKNKIKIIINKMISNEIEMTYTFLRFYNDEKSINDIINKTKRKIDLNSKNSNGDTILIKLSQRDNFLARKLLIKSGADADVLTKDGDTLLMDATYWGNEKEVKFLLNNGANPNIEHKSGYTALMYVFENLNDKNVNIKYKILNHLLKNGGNINHKYKKITEGRRDFANFYTLLHRVTSSTNNPKFINLLIKYGVNVNIEFPYKNASVSALNFSIQKLSTAASTRQVSDKLDEILGLLGEKDSTTKKRELPYRYPSYNSVKILLDSGAKIDKNYPYLKYVEDLNLRKLLIKAGANINVSD